MITTQSHISERTFQGGRKFQSIKVCQWKNNENMCFGCMFRAYLQVIPYHFPSYTFLYAMFYTELFEKMVSNTHTQPPNPATCKAKKRSQLLNIQNTNSKHYKQIYLAPELFIIYPFSTLPSEIPSKTLVAIPETSRPIFPFFGPARKTLAKLNISKWPKTRTITHRLPCWCCWCGRYRWSVSGTTPGISGRPGICHGFYMAGRQRFFFGKLEPNKTCRGKSGETTALSDLFHGRTLWFWGFLGFWITPGEYIIPEAP